jgi:hypothetical protein
MRTVLSGFVLGFGIGAAMGLVFFPLRQMRNVGNRNVVQSTMRSMTNNVKYDHKYYYDLLATTTTYALVPRNYGTKSRSPFVMTIMMGGIFFACIMGVGGLMRCDDRSSCGTSSSAGRLLSSAEEQRQQQLLWSKMDFLMSQQQSRKD